MTDQLPFLPRNATTIRPLLSTKMRTVKIPVNDRHISFMPDPDPLSPRYTVIAYVRVLDLKDNIPMDVNPRDQNLNSKVARDIAKTLLQNPRNFPHYNRGLTVLAEECKYDNRDNTLYLGFPDKDERPQPPIGPEGEVDLSEHVLNKDYGLVDGGHTFKKVLQVVEKLKENSERDLVHAYIKLEIIVGMDDTAAIELAWARNNSMQVKQFSLANLDGSFDWIKQALDETNHGKFVVYSENEKSRNEIQTGDKRRLDIRDIVRLTTALHPKWQGEDNPPMIAYTATGNALQIFVAEEEKFRDSHEPTGFRKLRRILPDILEMYWEIKSTFADTYREIGGETAVKKRQDEGLEVEKAIGRGRGKAGRSEYFSARDFKEYMGDYETDLVPPEAFVIPILSAFRAILIETNDGNDVTWKVNPFALYRENRHKYVSNIIGQAIDLKKPNALGKNKTIWKLLYLSVDKDAEKYLETRA